MNFIVFEELLICKRLNKCSAKKKKCIFKVLG